MNEYEKSSASDNEFVHFDALDLNLLRVFEALIEERSATRAGARLGLTQSAISHALNRLRYVLKDELFVRGPDGMQPTERAAEIAPRLRQGLAAAPTGAGAERIRRRRPPTDALRSPAPNTPARCYCPA